MHIVYNTATAQCLLTAIVVIDFVSAIVRSQMASSLDGGEMAPFLAIRHIVTLLFLLDAIIAAAVSPVRTIWTFLLHTADMMITSVSVVATFYDTGIPALTALRIARYIKGFAVASRLLARACLFRTLLVAIAAGLRPAVAALVILAIVLALYAVLVTDFFAAAAPADFDGIGKAAFSMFQALTEDKWTVLVREISDGGGGGGTSVFASLILVSCCLSCSFLLVNVVMATFLRCVRALARSNSGSEALHCRSGRALDRLRPAASPRA
jgi:hypothetical protein